MARQELKDRNQQKIPRTGIETEKAAAESPGRALQAQCQNTEPRARSSQSFDHSQGGSLARKGEARGFRVLETDLRLPDKTDRCRALFHVIK